MRREIDQRDIAFSPGHPDIVREVLGDRIIERDLAAIDHVREQETGERLGDRADVVSLGEVARERESLALPGAGHPDDDPAVRQ